MPALPVLDPHETYVSSADQFCTKLTLLILKSHASRSPSQLVASATPASAQAAAQTTAQWLAQPPVASFIAGGVAGAVSRTVVSPLERVKILLQVQNAGRNEYPTVGKALSKMWREEGWRGFMRGNGVNCVRIVPYSAVQFGSYNLYKQVRCLRSLHCEKTANRNQSISNPTPAPRSPSRRCAA